jgi:hypothetical protein
MCGRGPRQGLAEFEELAKTAEQGSRPNALRGSMGRLTATLELGLLNRERHAALRRWQAFREAFEYHKRRFAASSCSLA